MTGPEFRNLRLAARLSYRQAAKACKVALSTIQRWEADGPDCGTKSKRAITALYALAPEHDRPLRCPTCGQLPTEG